MKTPVLTLITTLIAIGVARAQFSIDWYSIDGGGGTSSGGGYTLTGTVGQPDAHTETLTGGGYSLEGGFLPGFIVPSSGDGPALLIQLSGTSLIISWSPDTAGFVLEQTDDLAAPVWSPAPAGNPTSPILPAGSTRFYRLIKQ